MTSTTDSPAGPARGSLLGNRVTRNCFMAALAKINGLPFFPKIAEFCDATLHTHCDPTVLYPGADLSGWVPVDANGDPSFGNLTGCDLAGVSFSGLPLWTTTFAYADLTGANFGGAVLYWGFVDPYSGINDELLTDLTGARITGANFGGAFARPETLLATDPDWTGTVLSAWFGWPDCCLPPPAYPLSVFAYGISPAWTTPPRIIDGARFEYALMDGLAGITIADFTCVSCSFGSFDVAGGFRFFGANMAGASLPGAVLSGSDVADSDLSAIDLSNADLTYLVCTGTDFTGADLSGADLSGADCSGADFTGADLTGTDFTGTILTGATF